MPRSPHTPGSPSSKPLLTRRNALGLSISAACATAIASVSASARESMLADELYRTVEPSELLAAARTIAALDIHGTFITVDASGSPRARTMATDLDVEESTFWMLTRPGSRKLDQLAQSPQSVLHFQDKEDWGYVSFMGRTRIHRDEATIRKRSFYGDELRDMLLPEFPSGVVMLELKIDVLEVAGRGIGVHPDTWQPQGVLV